jgi:hypothetical protein
MIKQTRRIIPVALAALLLFAGCEQESDGKFEGQFNNMASPTEVVVTPVSRRVSELAGKP